MARMVAPLETGLCCIDIECMVSFYIEVLDATWIATNDVSAEKAVEAGVGTCGFRNTRIELPTGERMKFLQPEVGPTPAVRPSALLDQQGTSYLTFIVDDLGEIVSRLKARTAIVLSEDGPVEIRPGLSILLARDPEGNVIEFVSYDDISSYRPELA